MTVPRQLRWGWTASIRVACRLRSMGLATFQETRWRRDRNSPQVTRFVLTLTPLGLDALQKADPGAGKPPRSSCTQPESEGGPKPAPGELLRTHLDTCGLRNQD